MIKVRRRPIEATALQWTGTNQDEFKKFVLGGLSVTKRMLSICNKDGDTVALPGDWVVKLPSGEYLGFGEKLFDEIYEKVE